MTDVTAILAIIAGPLSVLAVGFFGGHLTRKTSKEGNNIDSFEAMTTAFNANMKALEVRVQVAERTAQQAEERVKELSAQVEAIQEERDKERGEYKRMRSTVQRWFKQLEDHWIKHGVPDPMPLPSDEDMEWLGLERTIPKISDSQR